MSIEIKRYDSGLGMEERADGQYVLHSDHEAEVARLRAEVEAYRKDAERWRHVRDMDPDAVGPAHHVVECGTDSWGNPYYEYVTGDEADQVIDAAMGASA